MKELQYNGYTVKYQMVNYTGWNGQIRKGPKLISVTSPSGADVTLEANGESSNIGPTIEKLWLEGIKRGIRTISKPGYTWVSAADTGSRF